MPGSNTNECSTARVAHDVEAMRYDKYSYWRRDPNKIGIFILPVVLEC